MNSLDFRRQASEAFSFLARDYDYALAEEDETRVIWRSSKVQVTVQWDLRSYELDILLRPLSVTPAGAFRTLKGDGRIELSLSDLASWKEAEEVLVQLPAVVESSTELPPALTQMAHWLRDLGGPLLRGSTQEFLALDRHVAKHAAAMTRHFGRR